MVVSAIETVRLIAEECGGGDPNNVQLSRCDWDHSLDGKRLGDVTKARGLEPTIDDASPRSSSMGRWRSTRGG